MFSHYTASNKNVKRKKPRPADYFDEEIKRNQIRMTERLLKDDPSLKNYIGFLTECNSL